VSFAAGPELLRLGRAARRAALRRRPLLLAALALGFLLLGLVGVERYVSAYWLYRGFPPPTTPAGVPAGLLVTRSFSSPSLHRRARYDIYLPPGYARAAARGRRFPVLYLLHSPAGVPQGIFTAGALAARADVLVHERRMQPMIVVVPRARTGLFGNDTEWANAGAGRYEDFLLDAVRFVDGHYATRADRQDRGLGGLSMGAYGAANIALHHLGLFSVVLSWSGYFTQTPTGPFAGASRALLARNSPAAEVAGRAAAIRRLGLRAWIYQGTHDDVRVRDTAAFAHALARAGAEVRFAVYPGGHDWRLWRAQVPRQLEDASTWFATPPRRRSAS
jgi:enterochelin esterase-like enzyme